MLTSLKNRNYLNLNIKKWDNLADGYVNTLLRLKHYYPNTEILPKEWNQYRIISMGIIMPTKSGIHRVPMPK